MDAAQLRLPVDRARLCAAALASLAHVLLIGMLVAGSIRLYQQPAALEAGRINVFFPLLQNLPTPTVGKDRLQPSARRNLIPDDVGVPAGRALPAPVNPMPDNADSAAQGIDYGRMGQSLQSAHGVIHALRDRRSELAGPPAPKGKWVEFNKEVAESYTPDCLRPDALKNQPIVIGDYVLRPAGIPAIPFVVAAKLRGKCR